MEAKSRDDKVSLRTESSRLRRSVGKSLRPLRLTFDVQVRRTQQAIKHTLTERWYAWEDARKLAMDDESVDLTGEGPAYTFEKDYLEDDEQPQGGRAAST